MRFRKQRIIFGYASNGRANSNWHFPHIEISGPVIINILIKKIFKKIIKKSTYQHIKTSSLKGNSPIVFINHSLLNTENKVLSLNQVIASKIYNPFELLRIFIDRYLILEQQRFIMLPKLCTASPKICT